MSYMSELDIEKQNEEAYPVLVSMVRFIRKGEPIEVDVDDCEFLGIQEDMQGRDLLTFKYEGVEYSAYPFTRWK